MKVSVQIWDWPLRLFHWLLVLAVLGAYATGKLGGLLTEWHGRLGGLVLGLLVFRLIWGIIGTINARFVNFLPTFSRLATYFKGDWEGTGHNPLGALAIIAKLTVLMLLVVTGLFANDDIGFEGPLFHWVDKDLSDKLSGWHIWIVDLLLGLVALHVSAIIFYQLVKKTNLVLPMLTGKKQLPVTLAAKSMGSFSTLRFVVALLVATLVVWGVWNVGFSDYLASLINKMMV
ncbi:MAG: hypothetical protein RLZZ419_1415 [Pseudomonadota bacterium]|jgi:cytochrome b